RGGRTASVSPRGRAAFVVAELALALVLLSGAGLLLKTLSALQAVNPGFRPSGLVTVPLELPEARYTEVPEQTRVRERLLDAFSSPPFEGAAMVSEIPLSGIWLDHNFLIEGRPPIPQGEEPDLISRSIMGDYFTTMGIRLCRGRAFTADDRADAPLVGIVNERMVREFFPGEEPIGRRIRWARQEGEPRWIE